MFALLAGNQLKTRYRLLSLVTTTPLFGSWPARADAVSAGEGFSAPRQPGGSRESHTAWFGRRSASPHTAPSPELARRLAKRACCRQPVAASPWRGPTAAPVPPQTHAPARGRPSGGTPVALPSALSGAQSHARLH